jgi:hypothetical protein
MKGFFILSVIALGPWTSCDHGESISVVARSNYREILATGDNTGRIKVFKYPSSTTMVTKIVISHTEINKN